MIFNLWYFYYYLAFIIKCAIEINVTLTFYSFYPPWPSREPIGELHPQNLVPIQKAFSYCDAALKKDPQKLILCSSHTHTV